jgi:hypothetical protein
MTQIVECLPTKGKVQILELLSPTPQKRAGFVKIPRSFNKYKPHSFQIPIKRGMNN